MIRSGPGVLPGFRLRGDQAPLRSLMVASALSISGFAFPAFSQESAVPASAQTVSVFDAAPLPDTDLAATTGREQNNWLSATARNSSIVADNSVGDNSVTGNVSIGDSAFQNVSGVAMVNFNTGNNSSINAAMSVNLQINYASPAP